MQFRNEHSYRHLRLVVCATKSSAAIPNIDNVAGSGTALNSIVMFVKSIPLSAPAALLVVDPKTLELAWNPSTSKEVVLGLESLAIVNVLNKLVPWLSEPDRSRPPALFVIEKVPV